MGRMKAYWSSVLALCILPLLVGIAGAEFPNMEAVQNIDVDTKIPAFDYALFLTSTSTSKPYLQQKLDRPPEEEQLSVSFWVSLLPENDADNSYRTDNCTIMSGSLGASSFIVQHLNNFTGEDSFIAIHMFTKEGTVLTPDVSRKFPLMQNRWEWNMISFTWGQSIISIYLNGMNFTNLMDAVEMQDSNKDDTKKFSGDEIIINSGADLGTDGCSNLAVDELSVYDKVLTINELLALRVKPLNNSNQKFPDNTSQEFLKCVETPSKNEQAADVLSDIGSALYKPTNDVAKDLIKPEGVPEYFENLMKDDSIPIEDKEKAAKGCHTLMEQVSGVASTKEVTRDLLNFADSYGKSLLSYPGNSLQDKSDSVETIFERGLVGKDITLSPTIADGTQVKVPSSVFGNKNPVVALTVFPSNMTFPKGLAKQKETLVKSHVYSVTLDVADPSKLKDSIEMVFILTSKKAKVSRVYAEKPRCAFLIEDNTKWGTMGCEIIASSESSIKCKCQHATSFAILMTVSSTNYTKLDYMIMDILTYVGLFLSIVCLILTLIILFCLKELTSQRVQILKHLTIALLLSEIMFALGQVAIGVDVFCPLVMVATHYCFMAAFCWMLVQGIQLYMKVRRLMGGNIDILYYAVFAWGFPIILCAATYGIKNNVFAADQIHCFIPVEAIWFFVGPVLLILVANVGVICMVMHTFLTVKVNKDKSEKEKLKSATRAVIVMVPILGMTWIFGVFQVMLGSTGPMFAYIFIIMHPLQGVFMLLFHCIFNEEVRSAMLHRRNKVAANTENTLFTKIVKSRTENSVSDPTKFSVDNTASKF